MDNAYGDLDMLMFWADTVYYFPTYSSQVTACISMQCLLGGGVNDCCLDVQGLVCKTNLPATTSVRAPGVPQSVFVMESIMDQLAQQLKMDPYTLRQINFLQVVSRPRVRHRFLYRLVMLCTR